jgi:hypothetical protein
VVATSGGPAGAPSSTTPGIRRWLAAALSSALGLGLLALAVPRTVAAWNSMDGADLFAALALGRTPENDRLDAAMAGLKLAVAEVPAGNRYYMLASIELDRYRRLPATDPARPPWLEMAEGDLKRALLANPSDARASLMLAVVRAWRGAPARDVATALLHSMDHAPNMRELFLWRATYFWSAWGALTPEEAASVRSQLRAMWRNAPALRLSLLQSALAAGRTQELSLSLADEPGSQAELEQLKASISPKR